MINLIKQRQVKSAFVRNVGSKCRWIRAHRLQLNQFIEDEESFRVLRAKVYNIEKDIQELRDQVTNITLMPQSSFTFNGQSSVLTKTTPTSVLSSGATPTHPPPPPPLPPSPLMPTASMKVKVQPKTVLGQDFTASFLEELCTRPPRLRHVERSPGGRPIRVKRSIGPEGPSALSHALKKRYFALHTPPQVAADRSKISLDLPFS